MAELDNIPQRLAQKSQELGWRGVLAGKSRDEYLKLAESAEKDGDGIMAWQYRGLAALYSNDQSRLLSEAATIVTEGHDTGDMPSISGRINPFTED